MSNDMKAIRVPTGWSVIRRAYQPLRDKLEEGRASGVSDAMLLRAIDYWIARLNQDKIAILTGRAQASIVPPHWPKIRRTYRAITDWLAKAEKENASKTAQVVAIDYCIARLNQEKSSILLGLSFVRYPSR